MKVGDILTNNGWHFVRKETVGEGGKKHTRAWYGKGDQVLLAGDALHMVYLEMGMPAESSDVYYSEHYEPTESEIEQLKLQGLY